MQQSLSAQLSEEQIVLAFFAVKPAGQVKLTSPHVGLAAGNKDHKNIPHIIPNPQSPPQIKNSNLLNSKMQAPHQPIQNVIPVQQSLSAQLSEEQIVLAFFAVKPAGQVKLTSPHVGLAAGNKEHKKYPTPFPTLNANYSPNAQTSKNPKYKHHINQFEMSYQCSSHSPRSSARSRSCSRSSP